MLRIVQRAIEPSSGSQNFPTCFSILPRLSEACLAWHKIEAVHRRFLRLAESRAPLRRFRRAAESSGGSQSFAARPEPSSGSQNLAGRSRRFWRCTWKIPPPAELSVMRQGFPAASPSLPRRSRRFPRSAEPSQAPRKIRRAALSPIPLWRFKSRQEVTGIQLRAMPEVRESPSRDRGSSSPAGDGRR